MSGRRLTTRTGDGACRTSSTTIFQDRSIGLVLGDAGDNQVRCRLASRIPDQFVGIAFPLAGLLSPPNSPDIPQQAKRGRFRRDQESVARTDAPRSRMSVVQPRLREHAEGEPSVPGCAAKHIRTLDRFSSLGPRPVPGDAVIHWMSCRLLSGLRNAIGSRKEEAGGARGARSAGPVRPRPWSSGSSIASPVCQPRGCPK